MPPRGSSPRYAPRWYIKERVLDAADRPLETSTGASSTELLDVNVLSIVSAEYTARGVLKQSSSSYGALLASQTFDSNGRPVTLTFGDAAETERHFEYDDRMRLHTVQTYRGTPPLWSDPGYTTPSVGEPTQQLLLEDYELAYDLVDNVTQITDWRTPADWPSSTKPVTRTFDYDDDYRLLHTEYDYGGGTDTWTSPFVAENASLASVENEPRPSPHVSFNDRVLEQTHAYDHLGNIVGSTDNADGFFDRSLGAVTHGTATLGPHQLLSASNRVTASGSPRKGDLSASYDDAGNLTGLIVRRDGTCLPAGASCWQRFHYEWDELGQISRARRWDLSASSPNERDLNGDLTDALPGRAPDVELRYAYTAGGNRVLKTAVDPDSNQLHTVYIFSSLELRRTTFDGTDYVLNATTENVRLNGGGVTARVVYSEEDLPGLVSGGRHVFLELTDYLGSNTFVIDHETGELVEFTTYQAYGATESDYRPERWGSFRESYKFTGKEEDIEVGLAYFGARYLSVGLGRWLSPDAATIHGVAGDLNPYAYVHGRPTMAVDPDGNFAWDMVASVAASVVNPASAVFAAANIGTQAGMHLAQNGNFNSFGVNWGTQGVLGAIVTGHAASAASMGTGLAVGGAFGSSIWGAMAVGGLSGAAGGSAGYSAGAAIGAYEFTWTGLAASAGIGAGLGAATGALGHAFSDRPSAQEVRTQKAAGAAAYRASHSAGPVASQGGYRTAWEAARAALETYNPQSILSQNTGDILSTGREYGGLIYEQGGRYHYTSATISETEGTVDPWIQLKEVPADAQNRIVGDYHTHGGPHPEFDGEDFSGFHRGLGSSSPSMQAGTDIQESATDLIAHRGNILDTRRFTSFLGTPHGRFGIYNPHSGFVFHFSPNARLLPAGSAVPASVYSWH